MYCSGCGAAVVNGLRYCNHRGTGLQTEKIQTVKQSVPESLIWAIVGIFVVGIGSSIGLMAVLKQLFSANIGIALAFTSMIFLMMLVIETVFILLLLKQHGGVKNIARSSEPGRIGAAQTNLLAEQLSSITEDTTRAFEPVYSQRKAD